MTAPRFAGRRPTRTVTRPFAGGTLTLHYFDRPTTPTR